MADPTPLRPGPPHPAAQAVSSDIRIRPATAEDMAAVTAIYGHYVEHSAATFEEVLPPAEEMTARLEAIAAKGLPYLVAEAVSGSAAEGPRVVGYAYAGPYRPRTAYRYTVEDSVYVDHTCLGRGIGRMLLGALIEQCTALGYRQMIAVIGDSANTASIALHSQLGFKVIGALPATGRKFDRWIDTVLMQRSLGDGADTASNT